MFGINTDDNMEPVGALSPKDLKEWNSIMDTSRNLKAAATELEARKDLFWARLRTGNLSLRDRETISIEKGIVMGSVDKKIEDPVPEVPQLPELPEDAE
jgi:hypothetical protein